MTIAADYPGEYNINQVCAIYDELANGGWYYYSDPSSGDSYQDANLSLQRGKIGNTIGRGNCNDFAILMAALIESLGGSTRITFAYDIQNANGHAYAEVYLGNDRSSQIEDMYTWLKNEYNIRELSGINKTGNEVWLNLDWGFGHPGGSYFGEGSQRVFRAILWQSAQKVPPQIIPIIDNMENASNWEVIKDNNGSTINISSIPAKKGNGLQISYNLTEGGWVGIAKDIDPGIILNTSGLSLFYFVISEPVVIELKFIYENGTELSNSWNKLDSNTWSSLYTLYFNFKYTDSNINKSYNNEVNASKIKIIKIIFVNSLKFIYLE
jgi:hypothetical protein